MTCRKTSSETRPGIRGRLGGGRVGGLFSLYSIYVVQCASGGFTYDND